MDSTNITLSESTSIIDDNFVYGWENNDSTKVCKMRPVGVVNGANPSDISKTKYFNRGDDLNLKYLGEKVPYSEKRYSVFRGSQRVQAALKLGYTHIEAIVINE